MYYLDNATSFRINTSYLCFRNWLTRIEEVLTIGVHRVKLSYQPSGISISSLADFCVLLKDKVREMKISSNGQLTKSIILLKSIILIVLVLSPLTNAAQVSKSELKKLQKEANFKIVTISVYGISNAEEAILLETRLEALTQVSNCYVDYVNNTCTIIAGFTVRKEDILGITGRGGIKTSDYSEEIRWQTHQNSKKTIQYTNEKEQAKKIYGDPTEEEEKVRLKIETEMNARRKEEIQIAEKEKENQYKVNTSSNSNLPNDYPKYPGTGNKEEDDKNYAKAKEEWIQNNPEKYKSLSENNKNTVTEIPAEDFKKMSAEKQKHIKNNPSKYKIIE